MEDEGERLTQFLSLVPVAMTQGGESHPGCRILAGDGLFPWDPECQGEPDLGETNL